MEKLIFLLVICQFTESGCHYYSAAIRNDMIEKNDAVILD